MSSHIENDRRPTRTYRVSGFTVAATFSGAMALLGIGYAWSYAGLECADRMFAPVEHRMAEIPKIEYTAIKRVYGLTGACFTETVKRTFSQSRSPG
jgi:hypothetical protein